jgi:hypothetical protein
MPDESADGNATGPAIKASSDRHLNATFSLPSVPGLELSPGILDLWVTRPGGLDPPLQLPGRPSRGMSNQAPRLSLALSRDWGSRWWLRTGARTTSHEPRAVREGLSLNTRACTRYQPPEACLYYEYYTTRSPGRTVYCASYLHTGRHNQTLTRAYPCWPPLHNSRHGLRRHFWTGSVPAVPLARGMCVFLERRSPACYQRAAALGVGRSPAPSDLLSPADRLPKLFRKSDGIRLASRRVQSGCITSITLCASTKLYCQVCCYPSVGRSASFPRISRIGTPSFVLSKNGRERCQSMPMEGGRLMLEIVATQWCTKRPWLFHLLLCFAASP